MKVKEKDNGKEKEGGNKKVEVKFTGKIIFAASIRS